jgi:toxin ParE1/3/4
MARARSVVWAPRASRDLLDIWRYYARVASPDIADNVLRDIARAGEAIKRAPLARRSRDELLPGLRSALVPPHTIFYRVENADVEIVRVLHERRDFPALFGRRPRSRRDDPK